MTTDTGWQVILRTAKTTSWSPPCSCRGDSTWDDDEMSLEAPCHSPSWAGIQPSPWLLMDTLLIRLCGFKDSQAVSKWNKLFNYSLWGHCDWNIPIMSYWCQNCGRIGWKNSGECLMGKFQAERQDLIQLSAYDEILTLCSVQITCPTAVLLGHFPPFCRSMGN